MHLFRLNHFILILIVILTISIGLNCQTYIEKIAEQSVNKYTGDVNLPVPILSISSKNGISYNLVISYDSAVESQVDTWNKTKPTGVIGLGWSFDFEKIIYKDKNYYLNIGELEEEILLYEQVGDSDVYKMEMKNYKNWEITFYPNQNKWIIIDENGIKKVFGNPGEPSSPEYDPRNTMQWSSFINAEDNEIYAWNLSTINNIWGDSLFFNYSNETWEVDNTLSFTAASYIDSIHSTFGKNIKFLYDEKINNEDFQEYITPDTLETRRFETKFLDSVELLDHNSELIQKISFEYDLTGENATTKRSLTDILYLNASEDIHKRYEYTYYPINDIYPNKGAMKTITFPHGASIEYTYSSKSVNNSSKHISHDGYPECHVSNGGIIRIKANGSDYYTGAYVWRGEWVYYNGGHLNVPGLIDPIEEYTNCGDRYHWIGGDDDDGSANDDDEYDDEDEDVEEVIDPDDLLYQLVYDYLNGLNYPADNINLKVSRNFYAFNYNDTIEVGMIKNGEPELPAKLISFVNGYYYYWVKGNNLIVKTNGYTNFYRIVDSKLITSGSFEDNNLDFSHIDNPVTEVNINNGYQVYNINFNYNENDSTYQTSCDPSCEKGYYPKVTVSKDEDYGYSEFYFQSRWAEIIDNGTPLTDNIAVMWNFYMYGRPCIIKTYDSQDSLVSKITSTWQLFYIGRLGPEGEGDEEGNQKLVSFIKPLSRIETIEGIEKEYYNIYTDDKDNYPSDNWARIFWNTYGNYKNSVFLSSTFTKNSNEDTLSTTFIRLGELKNTFDIPDSVHIVSPIVKTIQKNNDIITNKTITTWKDWSETGSNKWAPESVYIWDGSIDADSLLNDLRGDCNGWLKKSDIISRDNKGNIIEINDIDSISTTILYDENTQIPKIKIFNSNYSEVTYQDFESGVYNEWSNLGSGGSVIQAASATGRFGLKLPGNEYNGISITINADNLDINNKYVFSAKVKNLSDLNNPAKIVVKLLYNNGSSEEYLSEYSSDIGQWEYLEKVIDLLNYNELTELSLYLVNGNNNETDYSEVYFDEIYFYPVDAFISGNTYDPSSYNILSEGDGFGNSLINEYDEFNRLKLSYMSDKTLFSGYNYYNSFLRNDNMIVPEDPNYMMNIKSKTGYYTSFTDESVEKSGWEAISGYWVIQDYKLLQNNNSYVNATCRLQQTQDSNMVYEFDVNTIDGSNFGFYFMTQYDGLSVDNGYLIEFVNNVYDEGLIKIYAVSGGVEHIINVNNEPVYFMDESIDGHWMILCDEGKLQLYKNNKMIDAVWIDDTYIWQTGDYVTFRTIESEIGFDNITIFTNPTVSIKYTNGSGAPIQQQIYGEDLIVSEIVYDNLGRPVIKTKNGKYENSFPVYKQDFVTDFNWDTGVMYGDISSFYPDDNGYPYNRIEYENNPLSRISESSIPGENFSIESGNTMKYDYLSQDSYYVTEITDQDNINNFIINDLLGRTKKKVQDAEGLELITEYIYNSSGYLEQIRLPNFFEPPSGSSAEDWTIDMAYDHFGNMTLQETPDVGLTQAKYDKTGRIRFIKDAAGSQDDIIKYRKYDILGRIKEEGLFELPSEINWEDLDQYADNWDWPLIPPTWKKLYFYDIDGESTGLRGALYMVSTNNDSLPSAEVMEKFKYDTKGNIIQKDTKIVNYNDSLFYSFNYEYNETGQIAKITYPSIDIPSVLRLRNETLSTGTYCAKDSIITESDGDGVIIPTGENVHFIAGESITLKPGFKVEQGANFSAQIGTVQSDYIDEVIYTYNNLGQIISIGTPEDEDYFAGYEYNPNGSLSKETVNNSNNAFDINYDYNSQGWLKEISSTLFQEQLRYTSGGIGGAGFYNGRIAKTDYLISKPNEDILNFYFSYNYDNAGRITNGINNFNSDFNYSAFSYDSNGNILSLYKGTTFLVYEYESGTNKLEQINNGELFSYDENGNILFSPEKELYLNYDKFTGLSQNITQPDNIETNFEYGGLNQRVLKTNIDISENETKTAYLRGLNDYPLIELEDNYVKGIYIYGPTGLVSMQDKNENLYFIIKDHLGSVSVVFNEDNESVSYYSYDPFGTIIESEVAFDIPYQYTGQEFDTETGLNNYRARMYDTDLKRFYSVDPLHQFATPYCYVGNNPVSFTDPTGMAWYRAWVNAYGATWCSWHWKEDSISEEFWDYYLDLMSYNSIPEDYPGGYTPIKSGGGGVDSKPNSNWDIVKDNYYELEIFNDQTLKISIVNLNPIPLNLSINSASNVDQSITMELEPFKEHLLEFYCFGKSPLYWKLIFTSSDQALLYLLMW
jgi:RHS repeat-associated protein